MQPSGDVLARGGDLNIFLFSFQTPLLPLLRMPFWSSLMLQQPVVHAGLGAGGGMC